MSELFECVLNFSEGQDETLIEEIVDAIKTAAVIDLHSDPDHNRSVVTFIGSGKETEQGAFNLTERAMQLLDLRGHEGVHPYLGVVDVIPFVPLRGGGMREAVGLARNLGEKLWEKLHLPVYFYGEAAIRPERRELSAVRQGGYRTLVQESNLPARRPDCGQGLHPTAGATAVGARKFLVAFNVNLKSTDVSLAQSIAKNIREKSGGLPGVRALGVELKSRGLTQVTVNLVDHQQTSLARVYQEIAKWAKEYEVDIIESELVGLVPGAAVFPGIKEELCLVNYSDHKILENYL